MCKRNGFAWALLALFLLVSGSHFSQAKPPDLPVDPKVACPDGEETSQPNVTLGYDLLLGQPYLKVHQLPTRDMDMEWQLEIGFPYLNEFLQHAGKALRNAPATPVSADEGEEQEEAPRQQFRQNNAERRATTTDDETGSYEQEEPLSSNRDKQRFQDMLYSTEPLDLVPVFPL